MIRTIKIARSYGFCMGVKRAIKIAERTADREQGLVTILNEIVHNESVVESFHNKGVGQKFSVADVDHGTLIISAHGVPPTVKRDAAAKKLKVVDATCPLVSQIYDIIHDVIPDGYHVIHFGDKDHDETIGVVGHAPDKITVISDIDDLTNYPEWADRKLGLTVQTTMGQDDFFKFRDAAIIKWPHIKVYDSICNATEERQRAVTDMAPDVDMILVVGSQTSANSKRLALIAKQLCGRGELIGSQEDIKEEWFTGANESVEHIGLTAGASTPDFLVEAAIKRLMDISGNTAEVISQDVSQRLSDVTTKTG